MITSQSIITNEYKHFEAALTHINTIFPTAITVEVENTQKHFTNVKIHAIHGQAVFALAIEFGKQVERERLKEYVKIMMEENKD